MAQTDLGKWMITNGGEYDPSVTYEQLTMVKYGNSTYITLKTVTGVTPDNDKINYQLMAQGFDATALSAVTAQDSQGLLGDKGSEVSAQSLIDALADKVMNTVIAKLGTGNLPAGMNDVISGLATLNSNLSISGTTLKNSSYLYRDIEVVKYGKIIQFKLNGLRNITPKTSIIITTLPDGYRPSKDIAWTCTHPLGYIYRISVNTIGQISVYNYSNTELLDNIVHTFSFIGQ